MSQLILLVGLFMGTFSALASVPPGDVSSLCADARLAQQPLQAEGRVVPLFSYAERLRKFLFVSPDCPQLSATALYCQLSQGRRAELERTAGCRFDLKVEHVETRELLGLGSGAKGIALELVRANRDRLVSRYQELSERGLQNGGFGTDLANLLTRMERLEKIESGADWTVALAPDVWVSLKDAQFAPGGRESTILSSLHRLSEQDAKTLQIESLYEKAKPFVLAIVICMAGFVFSLLSIQSSRFHTATLVCLGLLVAVEVAGITARIMISGRGPVTNMYETVMWAGIGIFALSIVLGFKLKNRKVWAMGFAGNAICLFMMNFATTMLSDSIRPLVPVLRDNFWLSTHVTTITFSYACFALTWLIANYVLVLAAFRRADRKAMEEWNRVGRLGIQIGSVFLAAGLIPGGVWADYSWGRFWGWDPKETWALIALVVYMVILHGRYVGWFQGLVFTSVAAFGFMFVLMAWFGVNYILAAGLHSYGFSSGGAMFLASALLGQVALLGAVWLRPAGQLWETPARSRA